MKISEEREEEKKRGRRTKVGRKGEETEEDGDKMRGRVKRRIMNY